MPHLNETVVLRVNGKLGERLHIIAEQAGMSRSTIIRSALNIILLERQKPSMIQEIIERAKKEQESELYVRTRNGENKQGNA